MATYNILCSHLAEPARFPQCSKKDLDAPTRMKRIKHKLGNEVRYVHFLTFDMNLYKIAYGWTLSLVVGVCMFGPLCYCSRPATHPHPHSLSMPALLASLPQAFQPLELHTSCEPSCVASTYGVTYIQQQTCSAGLRVTGFSPRCKGVPASSLFLIQDDFQKTIFPCAESRDEAWYQ